MLILYHWQRCIKRLRQKTSIRWKGLCWMKFRFVLLFIDSSNTVFIFSIFVTIVFVFVRWFCFSTTNRALCLFGISSRVIFVSCMFRLLITWSRTAWRTHCTHRSRLSSKQYASVSLNDCRSFNELMHMDVKRERRCMSKQLQINLFVNYF